MAEPRESGPQDILLDGLADRIAYREGKACVCGPAGQVGSLHYVLGYGADPRPCGHWGSHILKGFFLWQKPSSFPQLCPLAKFNLKEQSPSSPQKQH